MITPKQASQFGFTIVESLMAIVVAILMTAISPVIISVATRVQARRVELATLPPKLTLMVSGLGRLLLQAPQPTHSKSVSLESVAAPDSTANQTNLYCVDLDNLDNDGLSLDPDGCTYQSQRLIQAFAALPPSSDANDGYRLGLRVYRQMPLRTAVL